MVNNFESLDNVPDHIKKKLSYYVTNVGGRTFAILGLPPEVTGGVLARYSRAKTGMQLTLVNEFLDENGNPSQTKGTEIMDRVLNAFGDDSVGDLEGVHAGIEDISQLATKGLEDRRIGGSPIEQSTRYVKYDIKDKNGKWRYLRPKEVAESGLLKKYEKVNDRAFELYQQGVSDLMEFFKKELPRERYQINISRNGQNLTALESELMSDKERKAFNQAYSFTIRCAALDVGRCVLPSSTLTQLGLYGNGRFWSHVLSTLKSSELLEERERALELELELKKVIPTFIKRNKKNPKIAETNLRMRAISRELFNRIIPNTERVTLVSHAPYLDQIISSSLFPYCTISLEQIQQEVQKFPIEKKYEILNSYVGARQSRRDKSGRGLEAGYPITFDLVGGFAEYRDLERHRMLTQQRQILTTDLGFIIPPEIGIIGLEQQVKELAGMMADLNTDLRHSGLESASQYATLFNHQLRFMMGMNLREFQHLSELRTQPAGHFSYRSMVMEMADKLKARDSWSQLAYGFVDYSDPDNKISRAKEQSKIAGKNLAKNIDSGRDY